MLEGSQDRNKSLSTLKIQFDIGTESNRNCFEYAFRIRVSSKIERVDSVLRVSTTNNTNLHLNFAEPFPIPARLARKFCSFESDIG